MESHFSGAVPAMWWFNERIVLGMNIYVGNLPYSTTPDDLREIFASFGEVAAARIVNDRETGRAKGFGFVEMTNDEEARKAIEALNGSDIGGRKAVVNEARPREPRTFREKRFWLKYREKDSSGGKPGEFFYIQLPEMGKSWKKGRFLKKKFA